MLNFLASLQVSSGLGGASASKSFMEQYFGMTFFNFLSLLKCFSHN